MEFYLISSFVIEFKVKVRFTGLKCFLCYMHPCIEEATVKRSIRMRFEHKIDKINQDTFHLTNHFQITTSI